MKEGDEGEGHVEMRQGVRGLSGTCQEKVVKKKDESARRAEKDV